MFDGESCILIIVLARRFLGRREAFLTTYIHLLSLGFVAGRLTTYIFLVKILLFLGGPWFGSYSIYCIYLYLLFCHFLVSILELSRREATWDLGSIL